MIAHVDAGGGTVTADFTDTGDVALQLSSGPSTIAVTMTVDQAVQLGEQLAAATAPPGPGDASNPASTGAAETSSTAPVNDAPSTEAASLVARVGELEDDLDDLTLRVETLEAERKAASVAGPGSVDTAAGDALGKALEGPVTT